MTSEFGANPEYCNVHHAELHSRYLMPGPGLLIHRSIWSDRLYWPGPNVSHVSSPEPSSPCLYGEGVRADIRRDEPFCPVHVVVGLVDRHNCILIVLSQGLRRRIVAAACVWGNSLLVARGRIVWWLGPWSICH